MKNGSSEIVSYSSLPSYRQSMLSLPFSLSLSLQLFSFLQAYVSTFLLDVITALNLDRFSFYKPLHRVPFFSASVRSIFLSLFLIKGAKTLAFLRLLLSISLKKRGFEFELRCVEEEAIAFEDSELHTL
ncbi:hypothetical protein CKAN_01496600 [Cinnamomum micranthum f. kanehirae]|uniref:Uncharacterized protein n=1 Tax=Cinnamomum micranthum f. kanehirae TaxID=337451 RepID=A0A3S3MM08_9MAGN|nr:hypothetical protein CKAN_01496600 [Cinnamomum micranthum f. kanehirae]